ncbi:hypothetical protein PSP6_210188 [Paraburkholderia tropica]|nr:hypothetical protein PSP6_210188 [Paraburkholderia tropica]
MHALMQHTQLLNQGRFLHIQYGFYASHHVLSEVVLAWPLCLRGPAWFVFRMIFPTFADDSILR